MRENLGQLLSQRAQRTPDLEAMVEVETGRRFSWSELDARANRTAQALVELGVGPGDRVALLLMNGSEIFESYMAIAKLGGIAVPLNWRLVPDELSFLLRDCGAICLIYGDAFDENVAEIARRGSAGSGVGHWLRVGREDDRPDFALSYDAAQESASSAPPETLAGGDDDLLILYTSGTTGRPKGAVHTHRTALWGGTGFNLSLDMRYRDAWLLFMPAFHVGALNPFVSCMQRGMTCVVMRAFDAQAAWKVIERECVTNFIAVPAMLNAMLPAVERGEVDASSVRWILTGGAPVPVSLLEAYALHGIEILGGYGLTEACGLGCLCTPDETSARMGEIRVVDEKGRDCSAGEPGEVIMRGPSIMRAYWQLPEASAEAITDDWLHTGDVAALDEDGYVYIRDRLKDMIISGGENVYPAEVENLLHGHPGIFEVAVIGQPSERWGESPFAIVVRDESGLEERDVLDYCQGKLARFKQPRGVAFMDELPRNPSGKVLKRELRRLFPGPAPE